MPVNWAGLLGRVRRRPSPWEQAADTGRGGPPPSPRWRWRYRCSGRTWYAALVAAPRRRDCGGGTPRLPRRAELGDAPVQGRGQREDRGAGHSDQAAVPGDRADRGRNRRRTDVGVARPVRGRPRAARRCTGFGVSAQGRPTALTAFGSVPGVIATPWDMALTRDGRTIAYDAMACGQAPGRRSLDQPRNGYLAVVNAVTGQARHWTFTVGTGRGAQALHGTGDVSLSADGRVVAFADWVLRTDAAPGSLVRRGRVVARNRDLGRSTILGGLGNRPGTARPCISAPSGSGTTSRPGETGSCERLTSPPGGPAWCAASLGRRAHAGRRGPSIRPAGS